MTDINWDALSLDELKDIQKAATKAINSFEARNQQCCASHQGQLDGDIRRGSFFP